MNFNPLIEISDLNFSYGVKTTLENINFEIAVGKNLGIVGESGSGKSTLLKLILGILSPTSGSIRFNGSPLDLPNKDFERQFRQNVQVVFQDPYSSLDPRQRIDHLVSEPLRSLGLDRADGRDSKKARFLWREERAVEALESVGLSPDHLERYPREFSGGQRQRIAIARAIVSKPALLLADEPVSALDVTTRVLIIELLTELQETLGLTIAMVSHDLSLVATLASQTIVLEQGKIVESGATKEVLGNPAHPYTRKLLAALPRLHS